METAGKTEFIFERVYVETPVDTDGDGYADLIAAYVRRPARKSTDEKVPAVMVANPYLMFCNEEWYNLYDVNKELKVYPQQDISEADIRFDFDSYEPEKPAHARKTMGFAEEGAAVIDEDSVSFECISPLYRHLNEKGYASVFTGGLGTRGSDGYTLSGSREEILAFKSVIDWLNGRCRAFTDRSSNIEIRADWCTGNVALSAKSYLGTMCIGVAATGVEGLKAIIPEAGICDWYRYYRSNGLAVPPLEWQGDDINILAGYCFSRAKDPDDYARVKDGYDVALKGLEKLADRECGNYSRFWDERNYLNCIDNFKAAVFIIHGLNDWNVKTDQCYELFKALEEHGAERRILLHQGKHVYVYDLEGAGVVGMIERWLDHYLKGADNGAELEPKVLIESNIDQTSWLASQSWPPEDMRSASLSVSRNEEAGLMAMVPGEALASGTYTIYDDLSATVYDRGRDNQSEWLDELVLKCQAESGKSTALSFDIDLAALAEDIGRDGKGADEGESCVTDTSNDAPECAPGGLRISGTVSVDFEAAIDKKTAILSAMLVDTGKDLRYTGDLERAEDAEDTGADTPLIMGEGVQRFKAEHSLYRVISRAHMNAQNRLVNYRKEDIKPGKYYHYHMEMIPTDYTVKKGHGLKLIIYGTDAEQTLRPSVPVCITVDIGTVKASLCYKPA